MLKILKYSTYDLLRSRWAYLYLAFFLLFSGGLLYLSGDVSKVVISLMNVILILCPLIATMFGVMYYYNSREFTELLLAQPIRRRTIFWGQYLGLAISLSVSLVIGIGIPFVAYGILHGPETWNFFTLISNGVLLTFIFSGLAFLIGLKNENKIRGFGLAIVLWLFFAVVYDGLFLLSLILFKEYPLEGFSLAATVLNPIDLSRIMILLKLDISALMGYTGAVFQKFLGTALGMGLSLLTLALWTGLPVWTIQRAAKQKDF
ncbi:MAG: ABC transporter permease [Phaeodactylibacter xiamenensis]|uniref:Nitrous oxide metabolic protein n=1 Tax=Phaeodactylibacter xiamenensis TaxID=1524460 RepID=A0A098S0K5_9BACT|nr:ABC transporter permease subunit [Phaeodactylibacter xiamenensis]KGE85859.1 nitrous oxide metabolic protein [Phaeodactylibacter xiamenensis]MCR9053919.1 ABC-2 transporter permease [bacterium]